jgi:hypothetical protein
MVLLLRGIDGRDALSISSPAPHSYLPTPPRAKRLNRATCSPMREWAIHPPIGREQRREPSTCLSQHLRPMRWQSARIPHVEKTGRSSWSDPPDNSFNISHMVYGAAGINKIVPCTPEAPLKWRQAVY